eukprot:SAG11_NODE_12280_length_711_cov_0.926471_2_plen_29_part_01
MDEQQHTQSAVGAKLKLYASGSRPSAATP